MKIRLRFLKLFGWIHSNSVALIRLIGGVISFFLKLTSKGKYNKLRKKFLQYTKVIDVDPTGREWKLFFGNYIIYGVNVQEYYVYGFKNLSDKEKRKYVTDIGRYRYYKVLNGNYGRELFDNKYKTYQEYGKYYCRDLVLIEGDVDKEKCIDFLNKHPVCIYKPVDSSYGQGVELIKSNPESVESKAHEICQHSGLLEELIVQSGFMASLHPQSVNTIRMPAFRTKDGVIVHRPFLKTGVGDSVVDNGGAGGLFAAIDSESGITCTGGINEYGVRFATHPDTGIELKGLQLPDWEQVKQITEEIMQIHPETRYVGWDFAHTDKGWVLVEGNDTGEFVGQQMPYGYGCAAEVVEILGKLG